MFNLSSIRRMLLDVYGLLFDQAVCVFREGLRHAAIVHYLSSSPFPLSVCMCVYFSQSSSDDDTVSSVSQERVSRGRRDSVVSCRD